jgi:hypothetical protein
MVLGIKLVVDKSSAKEAGKTMRQEAEKAVKKEQRKKALDAEKSKVRKELGIDDGKGKKGGAGKAAAVGGFIGAIIGSLKPIQELLEVIGGIMKIFLIPILMLMKPFLILFLKLGLKLMKMFTGPGLETQKEALQGGRGLDTGDEVSGSAGEFIAGLKERFFTWLDGIFDGFNAASLFEAYISAFLLLFVSGLGNLFFGFLDILGGLWDLIIGIFTGDVELIIQAILKIFTGIFDSFMGVLKMVVGFFGIIGTLLGEGLVILWNRLQILVGIGQWLFDALVSVLSASLNVLNGIGAWILSKIKSFFGMGGGGKSTSVNDALITSDGDIVKFNPNDNIMAFQDPETLGKMGGGGRGGDVYITVEGSVWSEGDLAEIISKKLNEGSRGSTSNY